jgi:glutaminyl-tRNA synthetase
VKAEVRLYNQLFADPEPDVGGDLGKAINPNSLERLTGALVEPALVASNAEGAVQFERQGYFCLDPDSRPGLAVFNRTVGLRDSWAKVQAKGG